GRTSVVVHVVDCSQPLPAARAAFEQVMEELRRYEPALAGQVRLIVLNKVDLPGAEAHARTLGRELGEDWRCLPVSAKEGTGLDPLLEALEVEVTAAEGADGRPTLTVYRPRPARGRISVQRRGEAWLVRGRSVEEVGAGTDLDNPTAVARM